MKKVIALLLTAMLLAGIFCVGASAKWITELDYTYFFDFSSYTYGLGSVLSEGYIWIVLVIAVIAIAAIAVIVKKKKKK